MTWHEQKLSNERECYTPFPGLAGGSLEYEVIIGEVQHAKSTSFDKGTIFPGCPDLGQLITEHRSICCQSVGFLPFTGGSRPSSPTNSW